MTLEEQLIRDEGEVLHLYYDDLGVPTIGIGCNLRDVRVPKHIADQITIPREASRELFALRLVDARRALAAALPWTEQLDEVRREALINMVFNMGIGGLTKTNAKAVAALKRGDYSAMKLHLLGGPWERQTGVRARRVTQQLVTGERT